MKNQETSAEETLDETVTEEQELFTYIIDDNYTVITGLQAGYDNFYLFLIAYSVVIVITVVWTNRS